MRKEISCKEWLQRDLERLPYDRYSLQHQKDELEELEAEYTAIKATNYDKMPSGSGDNTQEEKLLSTIAKKTKLEAWINATERHVANMEALLSTLTEEDKIIIEKTVINRNKNAEDDVAEEIGIERRQVYNRKNAILHKLCQMRFGQGYQP